MRARLENRLPSHKRGYSDTWRQAARLYRQEHPLCEACLAVSRVSPSAEVDHIIPLEKGGELLDPANLQALCKRCHRNKTLLDKGVVRTGCDEHGRPLSPDHPWAGDSAIIPASLPRPAIPVVLVCGAPGSGKSSYARAVAMPGDVVIDLDAIVAELSGLPSHHAGREWLDMALAERNRRLGLLAHAKAGRAFLIVGAPCPSERTSWRALLGCSDVVLLTTPEAECLRRIRSARASSPQLHDMLAACRAWYRRFRPSPFDRRITFIPNDSAELSWLDHHKRHGEASG